MAGVETIRRRNVFVNNGYMFIFDAFSADGKKRFWRCRNRNICKARIHADVDDLTVLKRINEHSHDSDAAAVEAEVAVTKIKIRSQQTLESTSIVLNECTTELSQAAKVSDIIFLHQLC
jgi:hypothetical protein